MLNSIKTLKRLCQVTFIMFFIKKKFLMMTKKIQIVLLIFCVKLKLFTGHLKIFENPDCSKFKVLQGLFQNF